MSLNSTVDEHKQEKKCCTFCTFAVVAHQRFLSVETFNKLSVSTLSPRQADRSGLLQPIELHVRCLRATRDKLPRGLYAVSVALHQRLGGAAIAWCGERTTQHQCAAFTEPVEHQGRYYDTNLHINHNLLMVSVCLFAGQ